MELLGLQLGYCDTTIETHSLCLYRNAMQVLAGADKKVDVIIQASDGNIVDQHRWTSTGTTDRFILHPGYAVHAHVVI